MYLEGSISPIKKSKMVILQNQNPEDQFTTKPNLSEVIMYFSHNKAPACPSTNK
jgi:hypothetical protein